MKAKCKICNGKGYTRVYSSILDEMVKKECLCKVVKQWAKEAKKKPKPVKELVNERAQWAMDKKHGRLDD